MSQDMQSISKEIPLLTFNSLYNILREEKKLKSLQKLPDLFYEAVEKFLADKKQEIRYLKDGGDKERLRKEKHVLESSKKIIEEIINLRCVKVANVAIKNEIFGETLGKENVLEREEMFMIVVAKNAGKFCEVLK